ncbi:metallophosphoesterase [Haloprofundus halophilus]|uniref:metallophosphoesterase n=1 Tax=Haloprofundus halophilus TaxID=2283527 RepID=UPI000E431D4C|nr:metallophosphoesterase [Haloprofundus halophilus]
MLVGIVSDTHDNLDCVRAAVDHFESESVDTVVHCGDVVAPFSATPFDSSFEFYAVRGNNDGEWNLQSTVESFGTYLGEAGELTFDDLDVAVYHGTSGTLVDALVDCGDYDYVLHGHTHRREVEERGETVRVNPGGLPIPGADDAFHVAVLDTETGEVSSHEVA